MEKNTNKLGLAKIDLQATQFFISIAKKKNEQFFQVNNTDIWRMQIAKHNKTIIFNVIKIYMFELRYILNQLL